MQEAWAVLDWRRRPRHGLYSSPPAPSSEHELKRAHMPMTDRGVGTPGKYSYFIHRSLTFTYLTYALLKHRGQIL